MTHLSLIRRGFVLALCLSIAACGSDSPKDASDETSSKASSGSSSGSSSAVAPTPIDTDSKTEANTEASASESASESEAAKANDASTAKGGDPALLIGKWEPIAYVRPDGVELDLVDLPEAERADLSWEFGDDGSVQAGTSIGTVEVKEPKFIATNKATGEARTFRYTVTDTNLWVINPAGDVLKLKRAQ